MDVIHYTTTLKASGAEYKKIVFWNRFIRNKLELILSFVPALSSILFLFLGYGNGFFLFVYLIFWIYPFFVYTQFKKAVTYHLKHRDPSEDAPCEITFMENGIFAEIDSFDIRTVYNWNDFTTIYDKFGYYMMFKKGNMLVMLRKADIPEAMKEPAIQFMRKNVNQNECLLKF